MGTMRHNISHLVAHTSSNVKKVRCIAKFSKNVIGDLWMWLQLTLLQFEVARGPVGLVWGRCGTDLGPVGPRACPKSDPHDPDRTSDIPKLQPHELQTHP
jgi:hypothetical protein